MITYLKVFTSQVYSICNNTREFNLSYFNFITVSDIDSQSIL